MTEEATDMPTVSSPVAWTAADVTGIVGLFNGMLVAMEGRLIDKLNENSRGATERWAKHDREMDANREAVLSRFAKVETSILTVETCLNAHLDKEHDEELAAKARVQPVVVSAQYLSRNWKTVLLILFSILALAGLIDDATLRLFP
jgi:hypothetical protein